MGDKLLTNEITPVPADYSNGTYQALVNGAGSSTNIAVASHDGVGIRLNDRILSVIEFAATSNDLTDRSADFEITSNGNIQSDTATTGDVLLVTWEARSQA